MKVSGKIWKGVALSIPVSILLWILVVKVCFGTTYYVDSTVVDTNVASATPDFTTYNPTTFATDTGTASVFKTIADINAFSTLAAGDTIYFRKGQTWREQLTVPASGSAGHPITFAAYGSGVAPIIDGSDLVSGWASAVISGPVTLANTKLSSVANVAFIDLGATINIAQYPVGTLLSVYSVTNSAEGVSGYVKSAGVSETLSGAELLGNTTFEVTTGVTPVDSATLASINGGDPDKCLEVTVFTGKTYGSGRQTVTASVGTLLKSVFHMKEGTVTSCRTTLQKSASAYNKVFDTGYMHPVNWTTYTYYGIQNYATTQLDFQSVGSAGTTGLFDTASVQQVTLPGATGVRITSTSDGLTYDWATNTLSTVTSYNDASGYTYTITYPYVYSSACAWVPNQVFEDGVRLPYVTWDTNITTTAAAMSAGTWTLDDPNNLIYVWATDGADPDTHTMNVSHRDYGITTNAKDYVLIRNLNLKGANVSNVYLDGAHQSEVDYCLSTVGFAGATIANAAAKIQNSVVYGNSTGVDVNAAGYITNTIVNGNSTGLDEVGGTAVVTYSALQAAHAGTGNITSSPSFVNAGSDFHLLSSSPCINAGVDVGLTNDYAGKTVPQGSAPDMGAYEWSGGGVIPMLILSKWMHDRRN